MLNYKLCWHLIQLDELVGWCVDSTGGEAGREDNQPGMTKEDCYAQCEAGSMFKGCTYHAASSNCIRYSGNVVKSTGELCTELRCTEYTCYLQPG